jgi:hypothetical protein
MAVERKAPADRPSKRPRVDLARRVAWRQAQARSGGSLVRAARTFTKTVRKLDL